MRFRPIVIVSIAVLSLGGCYSTKTTSSNTTTPVSTNTVSIQNMAFSPSTITVSAGTTVTWTNSDGVTHTVTGTGSNVPSGFDSGNMGNDVSYSFTFSMPGTYVYKCAIHPSMTGTVVVQ